MVEQQADPVAVEQRVDPVVERPDLAARAPPAADPVVV